MSTGSRTHRWVVALTMAIPFAAPVAARAQMSGQGLPDLSGIADKISNSAAPKSTGGVFSSGLKVPSVKPGEAAKSLGRQLREKVEAQSGQKQPALQQMEDQMPTFLTQIEAQFVKLGLSKRDLGVAVAYAFITDYEVATGKKVPVDASVTAGKAIATATAKQWGPKFKTLSPAQQEDIYEKLVVGPMLLEGLHDQFAKAGRTKEAQGMSEAAGSTFKTLFGKSADSISINDSGKISGVGGGTATSGGDTDGGKAMTVRKTSPVAKTRPGAPVLTAGGLTPASTGGAKIFVRYKMYYGGAPEVRLEPLILFPDGSAFGDVPSKPLPDFTAASLRKYLKPYDVGNYKINGNQLLLTLGGKPETYVKDPSGGWTEPGHKAGSSFDVYFPIKVANKQQLYGQWKNKELTTMGMIGGGAPMVAAGSNNDLNFSPAGTFVKAGKSFASATTANMGDAFKTGGDTTVTGGGKSANAGQWRLDGPLLTTVENGLRGVQLVFILPHWGKDTEPPEILLQGSRWSRPGKD